jgi:hypothetical protein
VDEEAVYRAPGRGELLLLPCCGTRRIVNYSGVGGSGRGLLKIVIEALQHQLDESEKKV